MRCCAQLCAVFILTPKRKVKDGGRWTRHRNKIAEELKKHSHPLNVKSTDLYNIVNGQVAPTKVNVQDALHIGSTQSEKFAALLPDALHSKIEMKVKTMQEMKKVCIVNGKAIFDIDTVFARLLVVGQHRGWRGGDIYLPVRNIVLYFRLSSTSSGV